MLEATILLLVCILVFFGAVPYAKGRPNTFPIADRSTLFDIGILAGTILFLAPTIITLAKAVSSWVTKTSAAKITIKDASGKIIVSNVDPLDAKKIVEAIQDQRSP